MIQGRLPDHSWLPMISIHNENTNNTMQAE
jgi:hypothetical protein